MLTFHAYLGVRSHNRLWQPVPRLVKAALLRLASEQDGVANGKIVFANGSGKHNQTERDAVFFSGQTGSAAAQCLQNMHFIRRLQ